VPDVDYTQHENTFLHPKSETTSGWNWKVIRGGIARWHKVTFTLDLRLRFCESLSYRESTVRIFLQVLLFFFIFEGNEGKGIEEDILQLCSHLVTIKSRGQNVPHSLDSLNVAVATGNYSIFIFYFFITDVRNKSSIVCKGFGLTLKVNSQLK